MPNEKDKKQVLLRLSPSLWQEIASWAGDDFRSINGQIEFLLTECVRHRKKKRITLDKNQVHDMLKEITKSVEEEE